MPLIKSISGIRGTVGGRVGESLSPLDVVRFTAAYATLIRSGNPASNTIIVGRDARVSGEMLRDLVAGTLAGTGFDVTDIGLATTPTTALAVTTAKAAGGIILTASHNPGQWNALKLLNGRGEFLNAADGEELLAAAGEEAFVFADAGALGKIGKDDACTQRHVEHILSLPLVDAAAVREAGFRIVFDAVNSVGGLALPALLEALGVKEIIALNAAPTGHFAHNPEPLPEHLADIAQAVRERRADAGFAVDPDVDRLAIITERGDMFGEEYTLVAVADYVLQHTPGNTVSNLSSTRALRDITERYGQTYTPSAVGEVNVVETMKTTGAVIGGEGNGGIIYPPSHYGRDAMTGIALFLTYLARSGKTVSELRAKYPPYFMAKQRLETSAGDIADTLLYMLKKKYPDCPLTDIDGVKIDFPDKWAHVRQSNTEPIVRIYAEAKSMKEAEELARAIKEMIR